MKTCSVKSTIQELIDGYKKKYEAGKISKEQFERILRGLSQAVIKSEKAKDSSQG